MADHESQREAPTDVSGAALQSRIDALMQQLGRLEETLQHLDVRSTRLLDRVATRLGKEIKRYRDRLKQLEADTVKDGATRTGWIELGDLQRDTLPLFRECRRLIEGIFVRHVGLDEGVCAIADRLLDTLSDRCDIPWGRFCVLDEGESFSSVAAIIRLRFPEVSIWSVPIAAHEFGHFVSQELRVAGADGAYTFPFVDRLQQLERGDHAWWALQEHFADIFATYALGPSFACACLGLRFNPVRAGRDGVRHPSANRRAHAILRVLEKMDVAKGIARPYREAIDLLSRAWRVSVEQAGENTAIAARDVEAFNTTVDELYRLIERHVPDASYPGWVRAMTLAEAAGKGEARLPSLPGLEVADVLNAVWMHRMRKAGENSAAAGRLGHAALRLCQSLER